MYTHTYTPKPKTQVQKVRVPAALALLEECPLVHIEDLLPHLPDLASIDDVRDRVCHALVGYSDTIKVGVCVYAKIEASRPKALPSTFVYACKA